jgi:hypothetical protein
MTICKILEGILPKESVRGAPPPDKKLLEYHFVFACVWAFGGCMLVDKVRQARQTVAAGAAGMLSRKVAHSRKLACCVWCLTLAFLRQQLSV